MAREYEYVCKEPSNGEREREGPKKSVRDRVIVRESERDRGIARERARAIEWWRGIARKSERVRVIDRSIGAGGSPSSHRSTSPSPSAVALWLRPFLHRARRRRR